MGPNQECANGFRLEVCRSGAIADRGDQAGDDSSDENGVLYLT
jgi:hypothetical protein